MEQWKPVAGYEGLYEVSDAGQVRSLTASVKNRYSSRVRTGRVLKGTTDRGGYRQVGLSKNSRVTTHKVHRLVARAFLPAPAQLNACVDHLNFDTEDNRAVNLAWATVEENVRRSARAGRMDAACSPARAKKLTAEQVLSMRAKHAAGETVRALASAYAVSVRTARRVITRRIWMRV